MSRQKERDKDRSDKERNRAEEGKKLRENELQRAAGCSFGAGEAANIYPPLISRR